MAQLIVRRAALGDWLVWLVDDPDPEVAVSIEGDDGEAGPWWPMGRGPTRGDALAAAEDAVILLLRAVYAARGTADVITPVGVLEE